MLFEEICSVCAKVGYSTPHIPPWLRKDNLQNAVIVRCTCLHVVVQRNVLKPLQSIQTTTRQI